MPTGFLKFSSSTLLLLLLALISLSAQITVDSNPATIKLWPGIAPGSENVNIQENVQERSSDPEVKNRSINQVQHPMMEVFIPQKANGAAVLICPGGGYKNLSYDKEGVAIAKWFNSLGVAAFVLKYRMPAEGHLNGKDVPLQDAQRALRLIRSGAARWGIDSNKIGVIGFSAGGHLASSLGTIYDRKVYEPLDSIDRQSARPDYMVLIYPVISMESEITHKGSKNRLLGENPDEELIDRYSTDKLVNSNTPVSFLMHAKDDSVVIPLNSQLFHDALTASGVPSEIHFLPEGGHGFGMLKDNNAGVIWPELLKEWLISQEIIE